MWTDGLNSEKVREHYGYEESEEPGVWQGFWPKETVSERIKELPDVLTDILDFNKKTQVIFEYDPDFPRAYLRIIGTKTAREDGFM